MYQVNWKFTCHIKGTPLPFEDDFNGNHSRIKVSVVLFIAVAIMTVTHKYRLECEREILKSKEFQEEKTVNIGVMVTSSLKVSAITTLTWTLNFS